MRTHLLLVVLVAALVSATATVRSVAKVGADAKYAGFGGTRGVLAAAGWTTLLGDAGRRRIRARVDNGTVQELDIRVDASTRIRVVPVNNHVRLYLGAEKLDRRLDGKTRGIMTEFGVVTIGTTWARVQTLELDVKASRAGDGLATRVLKLRQLVPPVIGVLA